MNKKFFREYRRQIFWVLFSVLFIASFCLRLFPLRFAHFWDETVYLQHAEIMFSGRTGFSELAFRPPLLSIIYYLGFFIFHHAYVASILTALLTTVAAVIVFLIGRKVYGFNAGIFAGLLAGFLPFLLKNSNYLLTDVPLVTFMAASFYFALSRKKHLLFVSGVLCSFAVLMKFTAVLFFLVLGVYFLLRKTSLKELIYFCIGAAIIILPYFIWAHVNFGSFLNPFIVGSQMVGGFNEPLFFYFSEFIVAFSFLTVLGLVFWLVYFILKKKKAREIRIDLVLVFWIFLFLFYLTRVPHKELRYILPVCVPVVLLAGKGFAFFIDIFKGKIKAVLVLAFLISLVILVQPRISDIYSKGFVVSEPSEEMILSDYLIYNLSYGGIVYSNQRYPVIAYYSGLNVTPVWPQDERVYELIPDIMVEEGLFIGMYDAERYEPYKHPFSSWMNEDSRFNHLKDIGNFYIYEYDPGG